MLNRLVILFLVIAIYSMSALNAQEYRWKVGFNYFFDNQEYTESSFAHAQTMKGIWVAPVGGIAWHSTNSTNALYAGINLLSIPGTKKAVNKVQTVLYYQYESPKVQFRAGAFPKEEVLDNYSNFFFSDSIRHFKPLMQGVFFQVGRERNFVNVWMDWTGHATADTRESFYVGSSGKVAYGLFFADYQSYLFHHAGTLPGNPKYGVSEQFQGILSLGIEHDTENGFKGMAAAGVFAGIERDRQVDLTHTPVGFTARANAELWGFGTENTYYVGDARMRFFSQHGTQLYWGNRFLQATSYLQSKWYLQLMESNWVGVRLNANLHFTEGKAFCQQEFTVKVSVDNFSGKGNDKMSFPWMRIFR